jgi:hypothetical protein
MERVNGSVPRMNAEQAIAAAAKAIQREADDKVRADALDQREAKITARERQADAAAMKAFCDGVAAIGKRLDVLEEVRNQERLAEEIRQADEALKALQDDGDLEVKEAPSKLHAEEIETMGGASSAETAIGKDDQMTSSGSPSLPQRELEPYRLAEPMGALPKSNAADILEFGRTFISGRDRKAARKAARLSMRR